MDPTDWGITPGYDDVNGAWHHAPPATIEAFLAAMGATDGAPPPPANWVVVAGDRVDAGGQAELTLEDGTTLVLPDGVTPPDVPLGYHRLRRRDGSLDVRLVVSPGRCFLPDDLHAWGFAVQLPTLRSARSWGMGDLGDLRDLASWSARNHGAGLLLTNPLHAGRLGLPQEASPYSPSTRRYRNLLYLRLEDVPGWYGAADADPSLAALAAEARRLNSTSLVERDAVYRAKLAALETLWPRFRGDDDCERYCRAEGDSLLGYATFCFLEESGDGPPYPHPASAAILRLQDEQADRIAFHMWIQWLLDLQLDAAGAGAALMQDLAVGFDPAGADAWQYQDTIVAGVRVGAPPDEFNQAGQDWGLPPFDPWRLRAAGYEPFIQTIRNGFRHAGGLRIDHVMGLFRLFWVPAGGSPSEGTYVRYPWEDLLRIVALESQRAGAYCVGEDLGTVEDHVREELARAGVLSYRLLWFEDAPTREWPAQALGAVTTHDLPTVAGLWSESDLLDQLDAGVEPNEASMAAIRERVRDRSGLTDDAPVDDVVAAAYAQLAEAPCHLLVATLEDAVAAERRPNLPGTSSEARPNWSIPLPATLEEIQADPRIARLAAVLRRGPDSSP